MDPFFLRNRKVPLLAAAPLLLAFEEEVVDEVEEEFIGRRGRRRN